MTVPAAAETRRNLPAPPDLPVYSLAANQEIGGGKEAQHTARQLQNVWKRGIYNAAANWYNQILMSPDTPTPEAPKHGDSAQAPAVNAEPAGAATVATTGKRQAFREIRRELTDAELASPGVQKLLLDNLDRAESDCEVLQAYVERFHEADKRAAVLQEKLRTETAFEILFTVGVGIGCAIIGLAPSFWDQSAKGPIALAVGIVLVTGSAAARVYKK